MFLLSLFFYFGHYPVQLMKTYYLLDFLPVREDSLMHNVIVTLTLLFISLRPVCTKIRFLSTHDVQALKTKHDTPKYGLIYHAQLVGQASTKLKGKVSRMLAAKASLACR